MSDMSDLIFVSITVTCVNPDCENKDHDITFDVPQGCKVVCGVCGTTLVEAIL